MYESYSIENFIGKPFRYRDKGPDAFDCWTLSKAYLESRGIYIPDQQSIVDSILRHLKIRQVAEEHFIKIDKPEPDAIVLFKLHPPRVTHMGVVLPDKIRFIHIMEKRNVCIERLDNLIWKRVFEGYYRYDNTNKG